MKQRIAQLEAQLAEQQAAIAKQETMTTASTGGFADNVEVSGVLELNAYHSEADGTSNSESDIVVDTFELEIAADINDMVSATAIIEYADDEGLELLEGFAEIDAGAAIVTVGKASIPVAAINDTGWTSPLTDDFFDIQEGTAIVSFGNDAVAADVYTFANDDGDSLNSVGASISVTAADGVTLGAGYVSDLSDADFGTLATETDDAWRVNALAELGAVALSAEYLELDGQDTDPTFLALNAAFAAELATFYVGWSEIDDSNDDAERTVLGLERGFGENATISAEFVRDEDSAGSDTDTVNLVLVTEF